MDNKELEEYLSKIKNKDTIKNQHYVPRFYLKAFYNKDGKIEIIDKKKWEILKPRSVKNICSWDFFYAINNKWEEDLASQIIEDLLSRKENDFSGIYKEFLFDILNNKKIKEAHIWKLCDFVALLWMRSKRARQRLNSSLEKFNKQNKLKTKEIENNAIHLDFIIKEIFEWDFRINLKIKRIKIYISKNKTNFITTDNPVKEIQNNDKIGCYWIHFCSRLHLFSLSPNILIEFSDPIIKEKWKSKKKKNKN